MVGYVTNDDIDRIVDLMGALRKRDFNFSELQAKASGQDRYKNLELTKIIYALFECSALGNVHHRPSGTTYFTFKFRNRDSTLNVDERLILHKWLWKALNLV